MAFFDVRPIHMPNHQSATRFVAIMITPPREMKTITNQPGAPPLTSAAIAGPVVVVTTTVLVLAAVVIRVVFEEV